MKISKNKISALALAFFSGCTNFGRAYELKKISLGSSEFEVEVSKYSDAVPSEKTILIMPPTGGVNFIDRSYAKTFARDGFDVYILENWTGLSEESTDLELHQRLYERAQKAVGIVLDEIKSPFIGMLGTSVGALHSAVSVNQQERIQAFFMIVGGAPIMEIIINSDQKAMKDLKKARYKRYHFKNDEEYLLALQSAFHLEPMLLGEHYKNKSLGMVIATLDETVPTDYQVKLSDFWKPEYSLNLKNNHFWGIVKTWLFQDDEVLEFFRSASSKSALSK